MQPQLKSALIDSISSLALIDSLTELKQILAFNPEFFWSPTHGSAGFVGTSGGALPVPGDPMGLLTDLSQFGGKTQAEWLASAPELVSNSGPFVNTTGWALPLGQSVDAVGGALVITAAPSGGGARSVITISGLTVGRIYQVKLGTIGGTALLGQTVFRVTTDAGGLGTGAVVNTNAASNALFIFVATATTMYGALGVAANDATVSTTSLSLRELPGNHPRAGTWASPADASRTLLGRMPVTGRRNLLINTPLAGAVAGTPGTVATSWSRVLNGGTLTPSGETLRVQTTAARDIHNQPLSVLANTTYTFSILADVAISGTVQSHVNAAGLPAGAAIASYTLDGADVSAGTPTGTGPHRLGVRYTIAATSGTVQHYFGGGVVGNATCDAVFSQPQIELGSTATAYQKVVTALDVTEAGVPDVFYMRPNGLSNSMGFLNTVSARTIIAAVRVPSGYVGPDRFLTNDAETVNISAGGVAPDAPELVTNGGFDSDTGWTVETSWSVTGGQAVRVQDDTVKALLRPESIVAGNVYQVEFDVVSISGGAIQIILGEAKTQFSPSPGRIIHVLQAGSNGNVGIVARQTTNVVIDNISVKEVTDIWTNTDSGSTRINRMPGSEFDPDDWHLLTVEYPTAQDFTRLFYSAASGQFGSMDVAALAVFATPPSETDRNTVENILGGIIGL